MNDVLTDELYTRFRDLIQRGCGLFYPETRRSDLAHRLRMVLRDCQLEHLGALYAEAFKGGAIWELLVDHLTIGETYFFRNGPQFYALRRYVLPQLIEQRKQGRNSVRSLRIWSAGCATGEEPYSLAMLVSELLPDHQDWFVSILGTDINTTFLARAREGWYGEWSFRETSAAQRECWFVPEGKRWRVRPEVRRMVTFAQLNLVGQDYPSVTNGTSGLDLILCRNVTIYFDEPTTQQIIDRMYDALVPGGWLVVGHSEPRANIYQRFETHNFPQTVLYRKPLDAPIFVQTTKIQVPTLRQQDPPVMRVQQKQPAQPTLTQSQKRAVSVTTDESPPASDSLAMVMQLLKHGDKAQAEALIRHVLDVDGRNTAALCLLGRLYADRGDLVAARQVCIQILEIDPLCRDAYYLSAQLHEQHRNWDEALAAYRRAVFLDAAFVPGILGLAQTWLATGCFHEARRCYTNALTQLAQMPGNTMFDVLENVTAAHLTSEVAHQLQQIKHEMHSKCNS